MVAEVKPFATLVDFQAWLQAAPVNGSFCFAMKAKFTHHFIWRR